MSENENDKDKFVSISSRIKIIRGLLIGIDKENFNDMIDVLHEEYSQYEAIGIIDGHAYFDKLEQKKNQYNFAKALQNLYEANEKITDLKEFGE